MRGVHQLSRVIMKNRMIGVGLLLIGPLLLGGVPQAEAQQDEEQKGIDQGNYNIKQSIEFGG